MIGLQIDEHPQEVDEHPQEVDVYTELSERQCWCVLCVLGVSSAGYVQVYWVC